jgi:hypothetical protein
MKVVVPFRAGMLCRSTYEAAQAWEGGCEFYELRNSAEPVDASRYWPTYPELMTDLWARGDGMLMLEHDTVPHEDSLTEMNECTMSWCAYAYSGGGSGGSVDADCTYGALGCCKIGLGLIAATWECFSGWGRRDDLKVFPRNWQRCDQHLSFCVGMFSDINVHRHYPNVKHRVDRDYLTLDECSELSRGVIRPPTAEAPTDRGPMVMKDLGFWGNLQRADDAYRWLADAFGGIPVPPIVPRASDRALVAPPPVPALQQQVNRALGKRVVRWP